MTNTYSSESTTEQGKQAAAEVAQHAQGKAGEVAGSAKEEARSVARDAKDQAADVLGTARSELRNQAADQAKSLSATLTDISRQLGDMADGSNEPDAQVASLARSAADTLSQRAERIDADGIDGVIDDIKRFSRNRPGAFLLGSIATGFAIGRLAKHADLHQTTERAKGEIDAQQLEPEMGTAGTPQDIGTSKDNETSNVGRPVAGGLTS